MNAAEVREALRHRWPDSEYLTIREAPQDSMRQGRKLDLLIISQWSSRGHEREGVEIKVSIGDWRKELKEAEKADWWFRHVHRFWIAVPEDLADKVKEELPTGWGLLAVRENASVIKVKPDKHGAEHFTWNETIGLLRASADAGPNALLHARSEGERLGRQKAEAELQRTSSDGRAQAALDGLRAEISAFEEAAGVQFRGHMPGANLGAAMKLAMHWSASPAASRRAVQRARDELKRATEALELADTTFAELEA